MINKKYTVSLEVSKSLNEAFSRVIQLSKWWPEEFIGDQVKLNSEFIFQSGPGHFSKNKVIDFVPNKKFAWLTTDSLRKADNFDWSGTRMILALTPQNGNTLITFTYDGVVLENELDKLAEICDFTIKKNLYKFVESFTATIEVEKSPQEVFNCLKEVSKWWNREDFEGSSSQLNDEFVIHHPAAHYSKQKLVEVIPNKKIVWLVTDSILHWLEKDKHEWTDTRMIFEISPHNDKTLLQFTHEGLVPEKECYSRCEQGWTMIIKDRLFDCITDGKTI